MIDLDELEALYAKATPGEWRVSDNGNILTDTPKVGCDPEIFAIYYDDDGESPDADAVCAVFNALPELLRGYRVGMAVEGAPATLTIVDGIHNRTFTVMDSVPAGVYRLVPVPSNGASEG